MITSNQIAGITTELEAMRHYASKGYEVFIPIMSQSKADFIVVKGSVVKKVQVKKATWGKVGSHSYLQTRLYNGTAENKRQYKEGDFDEIIFINGNEIWIAPWKEVEGLTSVCLSGTKPGYKTRTDLYDPDNWKVHQ